MEPKMFRYQCQETAGCTGCTQAGVCGKKPDVAAMQDLLVYVPRALSAVTTRLRAEGREISPEVNHLITLNLFTTITNANFDKEAITARVRDTLAIKAELLAQVAQPESLPEAARWAGGEAEFESKAAQVGVLSTKDEDIRSLRELITYGLKGLSAYSKHAKALPRDAVILTAGCAKYKYNKLDLGDINGIPRVLDAGQCNDSYSLAVIALKLKEVFGLEDINDLPIVYNIAWYEQKAVIVLLALLYLGVKNIHLGPTLPAFLSPNVSKVLVDRFGIAGIGTVEDDLELLFGPERSAG